MKKILKSSLMVLALATLASCGGANTPKETTFKVEFMDGTNVLETVEVKENEKVENKDIKVEGKTFHGWYATPNFTFEFDFDNPITKDTKIFGNYTSFKADTRSFSIMGSGTSPILKQSNWGATTGIPGSEMVKQDKEGVNEYQITLDLVKGDKFQFGLTDKKFENARGLGYLKDKKDAQGVEHFTGSIGMSGDARRSDIEVVISGNYTITLTTYPDQDVYLTDAPDYVADRHEQFNVNNADTITWVRNGDLEQEVVVDVDFFLKGKNVSNWKNMYNDGNKMTKDGDVYTLTRALEPGDEVMFMSQFTQEGEVSQGNIYLKGGNLDTDENTKAAVKALENGNISPLKKGLYTFTYNAKTEKLSVTVDETKFLEERTYYINGIFTGHDKWGISEEFKLLSTEKNYVYTIKNVGFEVGHEFGIFGVKEGETKKAFYGFQYLFPNKDLAENFVQKGNNLECKVAGNYDVSFNAYSQQIIVELAK